MKNRLLAKSGAVMEAVCSADAPLSVRELSELLKLPVPTLSRLCRDLAELGWLEKTDYHHFAPGLAMIRFGSLSKRLSPLAAAAAPQIEALSRESGLNGQLAGCDGKHFFRLCSFALKASDVQIYRRSGADLALLFAAGLDAETAKNAILTAHPALSEVDRNAIDREFEALRTQDLLLRVGMMRHWYITVPFRHGGFGFAATFYGQGRADQSPERMCGKVAVLTARIRTLWSRAYRPKR